MVFANSWSHAGSVAVIGRKRSAQESWDDACTAGVPTFGLSGKREVAIATNLTAGLNSNLFPKGDTEMFKSFLKDETGAELAEYAVAVALLVAIGIIVYGVLGQGVSDANSQTGADIKSAKSNTGVTK